MIDLETLEPEFRERLLSVIETCAADRFRLIPEVGAIDPFLQARLWRQSRSDAEIDEAIADLKAQNCIYLAEVLEETEGKLGPKVTDSLPGLSWHNWREAVKVGIYDNCGRELMNHDEKAISVLRKAIKKHKLNSGENWGKSLFYIQKSTFENPKNLMSMLEIDKTMYDMWGIIR